MVELIPRQVLFGNPERISPRISPDGTQLAWIAPSDGVLNVWVAPAGTGQGEGIDWSAARVVTDDSDRGIRMFAWAHDGRHLLYLQDTGGTRTGVCTMSTSRRCSGATLPPSTMSRLSSSPGRRS